MVQAQVAQPGPPKGGVRCTLNAVVNQKAFSNSCGLPLAALVDFHPPEVLGIPRVPHAPARCRECRGYLNQYCKTWLDIASKWECVLCGTVNKWPTPTPGAPITAYPELCAEAVEYALTPPTSPAAPPGAPHVVVVVDTSVEPAMLANLRSALPAALQASISPETTISVIGCDSVVTLWAIAAPGLPSPVTAGSIFAHTITGETAMDAEGVASLQRNSSLFKATLGPAVTTGLLSSTLGALRPMFSHLPVRSRPRCLAVAIEAGLRLLATSADRAGSHGGHMHLPHGSRLLVITGGPPTTGPCAVPLSVLDAIGPVPPASTKTLEESRAHVSNLAAMAESLNVPIDVMAVDTPSVNVVLLSEVAEMSGGALWFHKGDSLLLQHALQSGLTRTWGTGAVLDCYVTDGLKLVQWLGPVTPVKDKAKGALSAASCHVGALCDGQGAVARLELEYDLTDINYAHVQVVLHYYDVLTQTKVTRVVTQRVKVVSTIREVLQGLDPVAVAVESGKRLVSDAVAAVAHRQMPALAAARAACSAQLILLASRFGKTQVSGGLLGLGSKREMHLPVQLAYQAQSLYALQKGRILAASEPPHSTQVDAQPQSPPAQTTSPAAAAAPKIHPEDRLLLMRTLLTADTATSAAIINPALYALVPLESPTSGSDAPTLPSMTSLVTSQAGGDAPQHAADVTPRVSGVPDHALASPLTKHSPFVHYQEGGNNASLESRGNSVTPDLAAGLSVVNVPSQGTSSAPPRFSMQPVPSLDLVLAVSKHEAARQPDAQLPVLVLDLGTRLVAWSSRSFGADAASTAATGHSELIEPLLNDHVPVQLLDRFPMPYLELHYGDQQSKSDDMASLLLPVQADPADYQLSQLSETLYCAASTQSKVVLSEAAQELEGARARGARSWLDAAAVDLATGKTGGWRAAGDALKAGGRRKPGQDRPLTMVEWCSDLGVLLPSGSM